MSRVLQMIGLAACVGSCGQPPLVIGGGADAGHDAGGRRPTPEVMLLVDASGSMVWKAGCVCSSRRCDECLPDCAVGEHPRWHDVLAAVSGSFDFLCIAKDRDNLDNGVTYDFGYPKPFYPLADGVEQRADGLLDRYESAVRFGLATSDDKRTFAGLGDLVSVDLFDVFLSQGADGEFSYGGPRSFTFPYEDKVDMVDTGIKSSLATEGALISFNGYPEPTIADIKRQLRGVRPFGGHPTASALDDLYYLFSNESSFSAQPQRYVILITSGPPDDDFRDYPVPGCDCAARGNCPDGEDPSKFSCPYPTAEEAAHTLHCGADASSCNGPIAQLHVVSYNPHQGNETLLPNERIAHAANGTAYSANTPQELTSVLDQAMSQILRDAAKRVAP